MRLQFKIQPFQTDAVMSVVDVFNGQPNRSMANYRIDKGRVLYNEGGRQIEAAQIDFEDIEIGMRNADIMLSDEQLLKNLHEVQDAADIKRSASLAKDNGRCSLDIEMETGTGKTYVYIKTMFELNKRYGWSKYIVVVPSIAIREGVRKTFEITADHFMNQYGKKARFFIYDSNNLTQIEQYSNSSDLYVMIINMQAFNSTLIEGGRSKEARKIFDKRDEFGSRRPIDVISANHPIVILDEPQRMGGSKTKEGIKRFKPLFTLNYSATHKETHNPVYRLDALDAYNKRLVKKIEVIGFELKNLTGTNRYVYLDGIKVSPDEAPMAVVTFETQLAGGGIKRVTRKMETGDSLYAASNNLREYEGFIISEVDPIGNGITFSNGIALKIGEAYGDMEADVKARLQIRQTINAHLRKERQLFKKGIKVLSLFFIDEVKNYREYDEDGHQVTGKFGRMFEEEYKDAVNENLSIFEPEYVEYIRSIRAEETHAGYFSIDKRKKKEEIEEDTYSMIIKEKELLLSYDSKVRFIFSHSALREGWDCPNVFQICALRQPDSAIQKRQEVGRGLRLCVNQQGTRMDSDTLGESVQDVNRLTVVASEGYAAFVGGLQTEIKEDLYERPTKINIYFFKDKTVETSSGKHTITETEAQEIWLNLRNSDYVTRDGGVSDTFRKAVEEGALQDLPNGLQPLTEGVYNALRSVYDDSMVTGMIDNAGKAEITENKLNDNFYRKEFQTLWHNINHKYAYRVSFDSEELIEKAVNAINNELRVAKMEYTVTRGEQRDNATFEQIQQGEMFNERQAEHDVVKTATVGNVTYDLIGQIAQKTKLTRKTVATILTGIKDEKFLLYHDNPEAFIAQTSRLITEQKATMVVEHLTYNQTEGSFDTAIFTEEKHSDYSRAYKGNKSIQPYIFTDGYSKESVEKGFVHELDISAEVVVYAKLPKGFHIPTPLGNYSPDWAIAFKEGTVQHVFFVAETKGSMSRLEVRGIEEAKIECARRLFRSLSTSNVSYDVVNDYNSLMTIVRGD